MFSRFFINRPIFATVIAIIMIIAGLIAVESLPVAQYPNITPPVVNVSASYPGADAKTVAETIGVPIEEQVNGVEGMMYMSSTSSDGSYNLSITFENGTDIDIAQVKVQNRVSQAQAQLPESVQQQGVNVGSHSSNMLMMVAIEGDSAYNYSGLYLTNYAQLNIVDELSRVEGVGNVGAYGAGEYSMRIWLDPDKMRVRGLTPADVSAAIQAQNMEVSAGSVGTPPTNGKNAFEYTLTAVGQLTDPAEFGNIIIRTDADGGMLRLSDVATVELGSDSYSMVAKVSGEEVGMLGISQVPGANAIEVAAKVKDRLASMEQYFPPGVHYKVVLDTTEFVDASIDDLLVTFVETTLIVMLVIFIFLQNWRAVIIPMITIPVSLIATLAVMKIMGFTLNTLTLFGLVLAIAIVVDDAIVVVEDCARIVSKGQMTSKQAAIKAMNELTGPVVGEVLVLLSVFIPTAFISGITGELYKQFALTIAVSTAFSGFNALTFTPAMCALFLKPKKEGGKQFFVFKWFNSGWARIVALYMNVVGKFLRRPWVAIGLYFVLMIIAFWGFIKWPTSYIPQEDMGYFMASVELPTGASLDRTNKVMAEVESRLLEFPEVENVVSISGTSFIGGGSSSNYGSFFVVLKPWKDREEKTERAQELVDEVDARMADIQEAVIFAINPPAIPGLGLTSGLQMQLLDINNLGPEAMAEAITEIQDASKDYPEISKITSMYEGEVPQYRLNINRNKVELLGLNLGDIYSAVSAYMGTDYVNDFVDFGRTYQVTLQAVDSARGTIDDVQKLTVRNSSGDMVPFSSFTEIEPVMGQSTVSRYNMYTTASVTASLADGASSSSGIAAMEDLVTKTLGGNYSYSWTGEAYQETQAGTTISVVMIFAIIMTLLVLAAQYESWTDPIAAILAMPTAILGTVVGVICMNQSISIYTQIGIILLLGLAAKNAILIVGYAVDFRKTGMPVREAAAQAGNIRFRPIMMTALAFVFGVMPMLFASGAGAQSQISLGCAVVFGMAINAFIGTLFVPNFWEMMENIGERLGLKRGQTPTPPQNSSTSDHSI